MAMQESVLSRRQRQPSRRGQTTLLDAAIDWGAVGVDCSLQHLLELQGHTGPKKRKDTRVQRSLRSEHCIGGECLLDWLGGMAGVERAPALDAQGAHLDALIRRMLIDCKQRAPRRGDDELALDLRKCVETL